MFEEGERLRYLAQLFSLLLVIIGILGLVVWAGLYFLAPYIEGFAGIKLPENIANVLLACFLPILGSGVLLNFYTSSGIKWFVVFGFVVLSVSFVSEIYGLYVLRGIFSKIALAYLIFLLFTMVSLAYFLTIIRRDED
ncbi:hypothetical protein TBGT1766_01637 [Thermotoga sp. TBGT1766]|uniref:hypothetical protein n=1 Tax=Thermotoga sp. Xyl54 TaxID=1235863 RepID=UPI000543458C|nr:hypothetical protein [Thermotoga sp. Xyl54]KHC94768.1 hypothetical protein TBGT1766_01637 [Thermotoga sp. TBGT1766]